VTIVTDCDHRLVHASTFAEGSLAGQVALWSCDFCQVRFYPACPTCVDVGHRNVVHPFSHSGLPASTVPVALAPGVAGMAGSPESPRGTRGRPLPPVKP
jgi:hypothetical protein